MKLSFKTRFCLCLTDLERDIQVLSYYCKYVLKMLFLVLTLLYGIKVHFEDISRLFGVQSWSLHTAKSGVNRDAFSQNIKTVSTWWNRRETRKSSSHFLSADKSLSVVSSSPDQESKNFGSRSEQRSCKTSKSR